MSLDPVVAEAIREAVEADGQPTAVADRLIAWFTALSTGGEDIRNTGEALRRLETVREAMELGPDAEEDVL